MKKEILLIEDESNLVEIYENILKQVGFEVKTLKYGKEGIKKLEQIKAKKTKKPDLVLLDLILPDINGIEILKKAKTDKETKDIPFFVLSNYSDPELEKLSKEFRVEKYIIKTDVTPIQLAKIIKEWFENKK